MQIVEAYNRRPEGMTAKQWPNDNNISEKRYYYLQRRVRKEILNIKDMTSEERLQERQRTIKPLGEQYFTWQKNSRRILDVT